MSEFSERIEIFKNAVKASPFYNKEDRKLALWVVDSIEGYALETIEQLQARGAINIIFDGPPNHESGRFVEVENDQGKSIKTGEWIDQKNGFWALRITELPLEGKP